MVSNGLTYPHCLHRPVFGRFCASARARLSKPHSASSLKKWMSLALLLIPVLAGQSQIPQLAPPPSLVVKNFPAYDFTSERGPHHRLRSTLAEGVDKQTGRATTKTNRLVEFSMGLHYLDQGAWKQSEELVEPAEGGAAARRGQHKVLFASNLNTAGAIALTTPEGRSMKSHVLGLAYYDASSGKSVLLSPLKNNRGVIEPPNRVVYADAFNDLEADVVFHYTRQGLAQWVILRERPPSPESLGLDPASTRLEVWTEFLEAPAPKLTPQLLRRQPDPVLRNTMVEPDVTDERLDFGQFQMIEGKAFEAQRDGPWETPVAKSWKIIDNRKVLIESVQHIEVRERLKNLPQAEGITAAVSPNRSLPATRVAINMTKTPMLLAQASPSREGLVLDYSAVISSSTPVSLLGGATFRVTGTVILSGPVQFGNEVVLKYDRGARLVLQNSVRTEGAVYMLGVDDHSRGEPIGSGNVTGEYADGALVLRGSPAGMRLSGFDIRDAKTGVEVASATDGVTLSGLKWTRCGTGVSAYYSRVGVENGTMCGVATPYSNLGGATILPVNTSVSATCPDDYGNILSEATPIPLGLAQSCTLSPPGDQDWFRIYVPQSGTLTVASRGSTDTVGYLMDATGAILISSDDNPAPNFGIALRVTPGTYYIRVHHFNERAGTGDYVLGTMLQTANTPPAISAPPPHIFVSGAPVTALAFTVSDYESPPEHLIVTASSSMPSVIPVSNIALGGSGASRSILMHPVAGQSGPVTITLTVSDGDLTSSASFVVNVLAPAPPPTPGAGPPPFNVNFGGGYAGSHNKTGAAAFGNASDVWNNAVSAGTYTSTRWANNTASDIVLTLASAGLWNISGNTDPMYRIYTFGYQADVQVRLDRVPPGTYDLYLYGHGDHAMQVGNFQVQAGGVYLGNKLTANSADYAQAAWSENLQYVVYRNVVVPSSSPSIFITASPTQSGPDGNFFALFSVINGLQLVSKTVETAAAPVLSPNGASYTGVQNITLTCATPSAVIRYTLNGLDPTESSTAYASPIPLTTTATLKARAFKAGMNASPIASALFTQLDTDADGLLDSWEQQYFGNLAQSANTDSDGDGLTNLQEWRLNLDPVRRDSDGNGVDDGDEDPDGDDLPTSFELRALTDPRNADTDGDGIKDPLEDTDNDGWLNYEEFLLGTNPAVPDPARNTVQIAVLNAICAENPVNPGSFLISRIGDPSRPLKVFIGLSGTADSEEDFEPVSEEVLFSAGQATKTVLINPIDDARFEGDERVTCEIYPDTSYAVGSASKASLTITDNDRPFVSVVATISEVSEKSAERGEFKFVKEGAVNAPLTVDLQWSGTALAGSDYQALPNTITFAVNQATARLNVAPVDDAISEGAENVTVRIAPSDRYVLSPGYETASVKIRDDDLPVVTVTSDGQNIASEAGQTSGRFTFKRVGAGDKPTIVYFNIRGSAGPGDTLTATGQAATSFPRSVVIPAGAGPVVFAHIDIRALDDPETESPESLTLTLAAGLDYRIGDSNEASVTIQDNEPSQVDFEVIRGTSIRGPDMPAELRLRRKGLLGATQEFRLVMCQFAGTTVLPGGATVRKLVPFVGLPGKFFQGDVLNNTVPTGPILPYPFYVRFLPNVARQESDCTPTTDLSVPSCPQASNLPCLTWHRQCRPRYLNRILVSSFPLDSTGPNA